MNEIDLIPTDYRNQIARRIWTKRLTMFMGILLLFNTSAFAAFQYKTWQVESDINELQKQQAITTQQHNELAQLQEENTGLMKKWQLLKGLRTGVAAESMFETIDRALPGNDLWFSRWEFQRAGIVTGKTPKTVNTGYFIVVPSDEATTSDEAMRVQTHMKIVGQARDHSALSQFVKRLFQQPQIEDVRVVKTSLRRYTTMNVVDFDLAIVINTNVGEDR